jgi:type II secretory pathway pseudopilin PulG
MVNLVTKNKIKISGFTIVEVAVIIVVIGIIASISFVAYGSLQKSTIETQVKSDLKNAVSAMENYRNFNGSYPASVAEAGFTPSQGVVLTSSVSADGKVLTIKSNNNSKIGGYYTITNTTDPVFVAVTPITCPSGFIVVPGSPTYNTSDFCVMKYEAKKVNVNGVDTAVSQAAGYPWSYITQANAAAVSSATCDGCHLITDNEWLTIAQNVLGVPSNWYGGVVGVNYIYSGHNDGGTYGSKIASTDDNDGYFNTGNSATDTTVRNGVIGISQRRTLTLSNGEVIWDFSGNMAEWTEKQCVGNQFGGGAYSLVEWTAATRDSLFLYLFPSNTGLANASTWNSSKGIGTIKNGLSDSSQRGFQRGGWFNYAVMSGVLGLDISSAPTFSSQTTGFRVAK